MRRTLSRRGGFTLVELLAVVAILGLLAALGTAAFLRARSGQEVKASEATVSTLRGLFDTRWKAVTDDARGDASNGRIPAAVVTFAGGDKDRALAVWTYLKLKNEFPTTIAEACNPVCVPVIVDPSNPSTWQATSVLQPKAVFTAGFKIPAGRVDVTGKPASTEDLERGRTLRESAACLHWAITNTAVRGQSIDVAGMNVGEMGEPIDITVVDPSTNAQTQLSPLTGRTFRDSWGNPIGFLRCGYTAEVDDKPYTTTKPPAAGVWKRDPVDPLGRLVDFTNVGAWSAAHLDAFWKIMYPLKADNRINQNPGPSIAPRPLGDSQHALLPLPAPVTPAYPGTPYPTFRSKSPTDKYPQDMTGPRNWVPALISPGPDKLLADDLGRGDDILSYRLNREGNRGN